MSPPVPLSIEAEFGSALAPAAKRTETKDFMIER
jgi:hypothetical protein